MCLPSTDRPFPTRHAAGDRALRDRRAPPRRARGGRAAALARVAQIAARARGRVARARGACDLTRDGIWRVRMCLRPRCSRSRCARARSWRHLLARPDVALTPRTSAVTVSRAARSLARQHALADVDGAAAVVADPASGALAALVGLALRCGAEMTWRTRIWSLRKRRRKPSGPRAEVERESPRTVRRRSESRRDRALQ